MPKNGKIGTWQKRTHSARSKKVRIDTKERSDRHSEETGSNGRSGQPEEGPRACSDATETRQEKCSIISFVTGYNEKSGLQERETINQPVRIEASAAFASAAPDDEEETRSYYPLEFCSLKNVAYIPLIQELYDEEDGNITPIVQLDS